MTETALALFAGAHVVLGEIVLLLALIIAVSGCDDVFVDLVFIGRSVWRWVCARPRLCAEALHDVAPKPMAIIIPAWDESDVIGAMLTRLLASLDYPDFRVFVGVYPNDPAGRAVVAAITDDRLQMVMCTRCGPTTKSDCLNHLWQAILNHEVLAGQRFKAVVLHDAEDVVHPQALRVHNALIPAIAMVQLPVVPLPDPESRWVSGHYLDEFAAGHIKDVVVREALGAAVPSAGVGCAIDRDVLARIADAAGGDPFDPTCLTEDYELGMRVKALGGRSALVRMRSKTGRAIIGTREHFPASFAAARRQKARWLLGIGLSGWDRLGWPGGFADRYMLMRDRKAVAAALLTMVAYLLTLLIVIDAVLVAIIPDLAALPPLFGRFERLVVTLNVALLTWRLAMRAACTAYDHGWAEGVRAVPRALVSNVINAAAAWVACQRYATSLHTGAAHHWDKTAHRFPAGPVSA